MWDCPMIRGFLKTRPFSVMCWILLLLLIVMITGCSPKPPSDSEIQTAIETPLLRQRQGFIKVVSLKKDVEEASGGTYRVRFVAEIEWLDTITERQSSNPSAFLTGGPRETPTQYLRGEQRRTGLGKDGGGFDPVRAVLNVRDTVHKQGDREQISGSMTCKKASRAWECTP